VTGVVKSLNVSRLKLKYTTIATYLVWEKQTPSVSDYIGPKNATIVAGSLNIADTIPKETSTSSAV